MAKSRIQDIIAGRAGKAATYASLLLLVCLGGAIAAILIGKPKAPNVDLVSISTYVSVHSAQLSTSHTQIADGVYATTADGNGALLAQTQRMAEHISEVTDAEKDEEAVQVLRKAGTQLQKQAVTLDAFWLANEKILTATGRLQGAELAEQKAAKDSLQVYAAAYAQTLPTLQPAAEEVALWAQQQAEPTALPWIILGVMAVLALVLVVKVRLAGNDIPLVVEANVFEPLKDVKKACKDIVKNGKLERPIDYDEKDEIGDLIKSFNEMASVVGNTLNKLWDHEESNKETNRNLRRQEEKLWGTVKELKQTQAEMKQAEDKIVEANKKLSFMNTNLDKLVKERTDALQNTLDELKGTQNKMILSEKMAVLGQLVAGVAHEINSPLGAIKSSMANIKDSLPDLINKLPKVVAELNEEQKSCWQLLQKILKESNAEHLSLKEQRDLRKGFEEVLEDEDIDEYADVARNLIDGGVRRKEDLQKLLPLFTSDVDAYELSRLIYQMGAVYGNTRNVELAISKTNKIVFTLKNYSRRQDEDVLLPIQLEENMETILMLYNNQLKHGIDLHTDFQPVGQVLGNADEIGQVWTNIITNAIQAMGGKGKLEIKIWQEGDAAKVRLVDHGPGIPEDIRDKIFEPFFTTKKKGEGTGLGLDICKKIIEKHGGTLVLESEIGVGSTFTITLPIDKTKENGQAVGQTENAATQSA